MWLSVQLRTFRKDEMSTIIQPVMTSGISDTEAMCWLYKQGQSM